jgi:predicted aspartyl protease
VAVVVLVAAALLAPGAPPVTALNSGSPQVTAESLLVRWAEAVGGVERLRAVQATYTRARIEGSEGEGSVEEWSTSRGQRRQESRTASGEETTVFDGRRGWSRVDGQVRPLSPDETRGQISAAYLAGSRHLVPGRPPGECQYVGEDGPDHLQVLRITPRGGSPVRFFLDPATHLPVRSEREMVHSTLVIAYQEWRRVDGISVPGRRVLTTSDSAFSATETLEEIRLNPPLEAGRFEPPAAGPTDVRFDSDDHVARIPIEIHDSHVFFHGQLNDSNIVFTLDTGAYSNVIDEAHARAIGVPLIGQQRLFGAAGPTESAHVRGLSVRLPGVRIERQSFMTTPLRFLSGTTGLPVTAILGYDFFSRFVVEIDYRGREMRLFDPDRYRYRGKGASVPITLRENHPYVRARIRMPDGSDVDGDFVIDMGSGSTLLLAADFATAHGLPQSLTQKLETRGQAVGGELRVATGRLPGLQLGPFRVNDPVVHFPSGEITAPGTAGNIGGGFLRRFVVTLDYRRMRMILEPNAAFSEREEYDMSGLALSLGPDSSEVRIARVRAQSAGDDAGLKPGDLLERIDGHSASEIGLDSLRVLFRSERSYDLVVRRDHQAMTVTLRTRRQL